MDYLKPLKVALSITLTTVIVYIALAIWFLVAADSGYAFFQNFLNGLGLTSHGTFDIAKQTLSSFVLGLSSAIALSFSIGILFSSIYFRIAKPRPTDDLYRSSVKNPVQL